MALQLKRAERRGQRGDCPATWGVGGSVGKGPRGTPVRALTAARSRDVDGIREKATSRGCSPAALAARRPCSGSASPRGPLASGARPGLQSSRSNLAGASSAELGGGARRAAHAQNGLPGPRGLRSPAGPLARGEVERRPAWTRSSGCFSRTRPRKGTDGGTRPPTRP